MKASITETRQRWINAHAQVKICVKSEIAAGFKSKCMADGVSMASRIIEFMETEVGKPTLKQPAADAVFTRGQRRKAIKSILGLLDKILVMETLYMDNIPDNLRNSIVYERAEQAISSIEDAINLLTDAY